MPKVPRQDKAATHGRGGGQAVLRSDGLAEAIARLRRALRRGARVADLGNTLAVGQLELLAALAEHPGSRPGQLARLLNMRPNTATTIAAVLNLALSTLPARQRRTLAAAVPALHALAREVDRLADTPVTPAEPDAR